MRPRMLVAFCLTALLSPVLAGLPEDVWELPRTSTRFDHELKRLAAYPEETAEIEGAALRIVYRSDGIGLYYDDFSQQMRCVDGEMHIGVGDPAPE